jgi:uncharacterized protein YqfA (UPF0365 family)
MYQIVLATLGVEFYIPVIVLGLIALIMLVMMGQLISLWFQAFVSGTPIPFFNLLGMVLRKIPSRAVVTARITLYKAGLKHVSVSDLETHYLAGGKINRAVAAMIAADKANIDLSWKQATAIDLAGRDILEAVMTSVNPKVIDCPSSDNRAYITAIARNGIQLLCRARVTVRTNIQQLVGGATEETIIARVGEGIVSAIGSSETHFDVLSAPDAISKLVLNKGLDAQTAFSILSIDIATLDVGENIGARLQAEQAETNMKIARAKAEEMRAMAVAKEQENIALMKEMEAKVIEAEAQIPKAIAQAYNEGNLGIMDGIRIRNLQADTDMRKGFAKSSKEDKDNYNEGI